MLFIQYTQLNPATRTALIPQLWNQVAKITGGLKNRLFRKCSKCSLQHPCANTLKHESCSVQLRGQNLYLVAFVVKDVQMVSSAESWCCGLHDSRRTENCCFVVRHPTKLMIDSVQKGTKIFGTCNFDNFRGCSTITVYVNFTTRRWRSTRMGRGACPKLRPQRHLPFDSEFRQTSNVICAQQHFCIHTQQDQSCLNVLLYPSTLDSRQISTNAFLNMTITYTYCMHPNGGYFARNSLKDTLFYLYQIEQELWPL